MPSAVPSPVQSFTCVKIGWIRMADALNSSPSSGNGSSKFGCVQPVTERNIAPSTRRITRMAGKCMRRPTAAQATRSLLARRRQRVIHDAELPQVRREVVFRLQRELLADPCGALLDP